MEQSRERTSISVKNRYKARKLCVEALYLSQYCQLTKEDLLDLKWLTGTNLPVPDVMTYYRKLLLGIFSHKLELDDIIHKLAPKYDKQQIFKIDIAILEVGLFSLIYDEEVPDVVAINESIRLAKEYGGIEAHKFINGVLDAAYREKHPTKGRR